MGYVAVHFVPIAVTFDEDFAELLAGDVALRMERQLLASSLFGDYMYEEDDE